MAVDYQSKTGPKPTDVKPDPKPVVEPVVEPAPAVVNVSLPKVFDYAQDPIFQALLVGVVTKHGIEHFSTTGKNTVQARVQTLMRATDNIKEHLG